MTKEQLVAKIRIAFKDVKLEDGVGLWEGQGLDDYADKEKMLELRKRDERDNWDNIPYKDLAYCQSSLSFFDAKGMRFCLPKFLIFDILDEEIIEREGVNPPDVVFTLAYKLNDEYQKNRFSLFDDMQVQCVIDYLQYKLSKDDGDELINTAIDGWKQKMK